MPFISAARETKITVPAEIEVAIDHLAAFVEVSAFKQDSIDAEGEEALDDRTGRELAIFFIEKEQSLVEIRREDGREREELVLKSGDGAIFKEARAGGRDHHGIEDDRRRTALAEHLPHHLDRLGVGEHPDLYRADLEIVEEGVELSA